MNKISAMWKQMCVGAAFVLIMGCHPKQAGSQPLRREYPEASASHDVLATDSFQASDPDSDAGTAGHLPLADAAPASTAVKTRHGQTIDVAFLSVVEVLEHCADVAGRHWPSYEKMRPFDRAFIAERISNTGVDFINYNVQPANRHYSNTAILSSLEQKTGRPHEVLAHIGMVYFHGGEEWSKLAIQRVEDGANVKVGHKYALHFLKDEGTYRLDRCHYMPINEKPHSGAP